MPAGLLSSATAQLGKTIAGGTPGTPLKPPAGAKLTRATIVAVDQIINGNPTTTVRLPGSSKAVPAELAVGNTFAPGDVVEVLVAGTRVIVLSKTSSKMTPPTSEITLTSMQETIGFFGEIIPGITAIVPGPITSGEFVLEAQSPSADFQFQAIPDGFNSGFQFPFGPNDFSLQTPITTPPFISSMGNCHIPLYNHGPIGAQFNAGFGNGAIAWFVAIAAGGHVLQYPSVQPPFNIDVDPPSGPKGPGSLEVHTQIWATDLTYTNFLSAAGIRTYNYGTNGLLIGTYPFTLPQSDFGVILSGGSLSLDSIGILNSLTSTASVFLMGCMMSCQGLTPSGSVWPVSFS